MSIFGTAASAGGAQLPIFGFVVAVSKWTAIAPDDDTIILPYPTYGDFVVEKRLKVLDIFVGSSVVGMSYGRLQLVLGEPTTSISVEDAGDVLSRGDRVLIGIREEAAPAINYRWVWAGYVTRLQMTIGANAEQVIYRLRGPEWIWGEGGGSGASNLFIGQLRRTGDADDAYADDDTTVTAAADLTKVEVDPAVFNPGGRQNMTVHDVTLKTALAGRIWEIPDRKIQGTDAAAKWTVKQACKLALALRNDVTKSGITDPDFETMTEITNGDILRHTMIEGLGLWSALKEICGEKYGFWVDPRPSSMTWAGFTINFFNRAGGGAANLHLDPRGTAIGDATPCISRLDLTSDIEKVVNKISVHGKYLYHLSLRYVGGKTDANGTKVNMLQHGWSKSEGDLKDYAAQTNPKYVSGSSDPAKKGRYEVTEVTISKAGLLSTWRRKFTTSGVDYEKYKHIFRLFVWNEAGEWRGDGDTPNKPIYYPNTNGASFDWVYPSVKALWGGAYEHVRRRRPLVDGKWFDNSVDTFRRTRPQLFLAIMGADGETLGPWLKVSTSKYKLDEERAAVWITADDLSIWCPFDKEQEPELNLPNDGRSFATLMYQGVLRLALEGCVEGDKTQISSRAVPVDSGSPFYRCHAISTGAEFLKMADYNPGDGFVLTSPGTLVDDTANADLIADQALEAGKDAQVHSSILVEPDWPLQAIGKTIDVIAGRGIPMMAGQSALTGRPAQIVAFRMDMEVMKWELLTESAALALKDTLRKASVERRERKTERDLDAKRNTAPARQSDINVKPGGDYIE